MHGAVFMCLCAHVSVRVQECECVRVCVCVCMCAVLNGVVREALSDKMTFWKQSARSEVVSHAGGGEECSRCTQCKGPGAGLGLVCWRLSTELVWLQLSLHLMASAFFDSGSVYPVRNAWGGMAWPGSRAICTDWVNLAFLIQ